MNENIEKLKRVIKERYGTHEMPKEFARGETLNETIEKAIANANEMSVGGTSLQWVKKKEDDAYVDNYDEYLYDIIDYQYKICGIYKLEISATLVDGGSLWLNGATSGDTIEVWEDGDTKTICIAYFTDVGDSIFYSERGADIHYTLYELCDANGQAVDNTYWLSL